MSNRSSGSSPTAATRGDIVELHEFDRWPARWVWPLFAAMLALQGLAAALPTAYWPWLPVLWLAIAGIMFVFTLAFHDAAHGRFHPVHWMNEMYGHLVGSFSLIPLHVYRFCHAKHHAQLARQADPELWPFNTPGTSRPLRVLAAMVEIVFGIVYTPLLFLRGVVVGKPAPQVRRRIVRGYLAGIVVWMLVIAVVQYLQMWRPMLVAVLIPMAISAILQTLNKFEQHLGLHGRSVLGLTRTVVDSTQATKLVSASMLYNDYHGTHHRYARIPYYHLPSATPYTLAGASEHAPVFSNIASACLDMFRCLADPKAGPQWNDCEQPSPAKPPSPGRSTEVVQPVYTGEYYSDSESSTPTGG